MESSTIDPHLARQFSLNGKLTRRSFVQVLALAGGGIFFEGRATALTNPSINKGYKVQPLPGIVYKQSFLRMCKRARFSTFDKAVKAVVFCDQPYMVVGSS